MEYRRMLCASNPPDWANRATGCQVVQQGDNTRTQGLFRTCAPSGSQFVVAPTDRVPGERGYSEADVSPKRPYLSLLHSALALRASSPEPGVSVADY